uniref:MYND-type domain-containing protein n=1 Tax=Glossina palpalis gambiensis TaxID=67801 RepID=A0A1B0BMQ3_9MUSC
MDSQHMFLTPQPPPPLPISSHLSTQNAKMQLSHHQSQQQQQQQQQCAICGTTQDLLRCSKCKTIYYCSTQHQHIDWPNHKHECRSLAKQRLSNIKLQQVTNGCNAINISGPTINAPASSKPSSAISSPLSNMSASSIILGTHENEILYSKAESVTQPANSSAYFGNMLANSTTMEQMHAHNGVNQHLINQYEKSSSYRIGTTATFDDHVMGNAKCLIVFSENFICADSQVTLIKNNQ